MKIYRCKICNKTLVVLNNVETATTCCDQEMELLKAKEDDQKAGEKHMPQVSICFKRVRVKIAAQPHPQSEEHHIEWIMLETYNGFQVKYLEPGDKPCATFKITNSSYPKAVYCYCNVHGLWKKEIDCG